MNNQVAPDQDGAEDIDNAELADEAAAAIDDLAGAAEEISAAASNVTGPFKIIVTQLQIVSAVTVSMPISWPSLISDFTLSMSFLRFDLAAVFRVGCMSEVNEVMFMVFGLTSVLIMLAIVATVMYLALVVDSIKAKDVFYSSAQFVAFLAYPEVDPVCCAQVLNVTFRWQWCRWAHFTVWISSILFTRQATSREHAMTAIGRWKLPLRSSAL